MKPYTIPNSYKDDPQGLDAVNRRLNEILSYLEKDAAFRQGLITKQEEQIEKLKALGAGKDTEILMLKEQLQECRHAGEGTRQLINKLLNDIDKYRKDIEWYQRTYETRSLPGTIWQKLFRKKVR